MFSSHVAKVAELLKASSQTVTVVESSAGGLIAANLLSVEGASQYFVGSSVAYTPKSRRAFLQLDRAAVKTLEPLTEAMALEFALGAQRQLGTDWAIAELGAAGPGGTPYGHAAGRCVLAVTGPVTKTLSLETGSNERQENMLAFAEAALALFAETLVEFAQADQ